jgi:hypothetical protein
MTHLHMARKASTIRAYAEPGGYEARRPYLGIIAVDHLTSSTVYVHGAARSTAQPTRPR